MSKDLFERERELCMLFIKDNESEGLSFDYSISNKSVDLVVRYNNQNDWDIGKGRENINRLWRNFNLAFIGYKTNCVVLNYRTIHNKFVTEYFFPMIKFNIENFHSKEFREKYKMSINISIEEYELLKNFKDQLEEKKKEFFNLNLKIIEREDKMYERVEVYEKEKKIAYETLSILNKEIDKARLLLDSVRKECADNRLKIIDLEKK